MMQTQQHPTPQHPSPTTDVPPSNEHHSMEKELETAGSENSLDEKKESSISAETIGSNNAINGYMNDNNNGLPPHQQQQLHHYNPYAQYHHHHHHHMMAAPVPTMNGMIHHPHHPPQQVCVNSFMQHQQQHPTGSGTAVGHLETQFQSLGFAETSNGGGNGNDEENNNDKNNHGSSNNNNNNSPHDNNEDGEDGLGEDEDDEEHMEGEDEPCKLFVGQVPKTMNEEDIFPTFDSFGPLKDVSIIRDKHTQLHRGCAFVTYWSAEDADKATEALHGKHTFPGARRPAQVKPAEPSVPENKLFIGMLSRKAGEEDVLELFAPFGEIREIYMIRNADGTSKCAAFLRYVQRESAIQAIESLHSNLVMDGAARPLIVKFADNKHQRQQRHMRNVRRQELMVAMGGPGGYSGYQVPPHMAMGPPHSGGPQYAPMGPPPQYGAPYAGPGTGPHPHAAHHPHAPPHPYMYPPHQYAAAHHAHYGYQNRQDPNSSNRNPNNPRPREGPAGANLFVYHLPHDLTDADLATAFNPFGNVISAKVYVDRYTGESKGFGFVSYDSVISAESAIEQMNGFQIGNKRLKVQHKRVHGNHSGGSSHDHPSSSSSPDMLDSTGGVGQEPLAAQIPSSQPPVVPPAHTSAPTTVGDGSNPPTTHPDVPPAI